MTTQPALGTGQLVTTDLTVGGMTCAACVRRVEKRLGKLEGDLVPFTLDFERSGAVKVVAVVVRPAEASL